MKSGRELYPLTSPQKAMWYIEKMYPGTSIGNIAGTSRMKGKCDFATLEKAINVFIEKNDSIRLRIVKQNDAPMQYVAEYKYRKIDFFDFTDKGIEELYKWNEQKTYEPFNLMDSDLGYFSMIKISNEEWGFYIKLHHTITDAWTMTMITGQVIDNYTNILKQNEIDKKPNPSYIEYIQSEQGYIKSEKFKKDRKYWMEKFATIPEPTILKSKKSNYTSTKAKRKTFIVPQKLVKKMHQYCQKCKTSAFSLFFAALSMYFSRISERKDMVFGTMVLNRSNFKEKNMTGMFISTVPIRVQISDGVDFGTFVQNITKDWMSILRYQRYPYDMLLKEIREEHNTTENLYDISLSYQNAKFVKGEHVNDCQSRWNFCGHQVESLVIHINDREDEDNLIIDYDFLTDLFHSKEIEFIHQHIINLLWHGLDSPAKEICKLDMLSEKERQKILYEFNDTKIDYSKDKTIHQFFEEQVERTPDNIAVVFEDKQLTYRELNEKSNQLARVLREKDVKPDSIVGLMVYRSLEMMIGIMGILKAGGAYLPIDPEYPEDRIKYMLEDSGTGILLTQKSLSEKLDFKGEKIVLDNRQIFVGEKTDLEKVNKPSDLIYVIYTSGSTGKPKGVMLEHKLVSNFIRGITDKIEFSMDKAIISVTTISFDIFVLETLLPLTRGLKIVLANEQQQRMPRQLNDVMVKNKVTMIQTTPSRMQLLLSEGSNLNCFNQLTEIMVGGETFPKTLLEKLKDISKAKIYNLYGPTETTVWSAIKDLTEEKEINIGKPIANTQIYLLDKYLNPVPIGIPAEMYIGGDGVARGYFNKADLTSERFLPNPFVKGTKIYRTGDLARWYSEGDIEHLGRTDFQVKIRGNRIELEEIENQLDRYHAIIKSAVIAKEDKNANKYLCAYIVCKEEIPISDLKLYLLKELPKYMIPSYFIKLEQLPSTPNGKVDKKLLPEPEGNAETGTAYTPPGNEIEEKLIEIWSDILEVKGFGINEDFFSLGGDSLNATSLTTEIGKEFNVVISLEQIYKDPTIKGMADYIVHADESMVIYQQENLLLMKKGSNSDNHIFFIHAGNGETTIYGDISNSLRDDVNCWGIRADRLNNYAPKNITIEEMAEKYLRIIKSIQPHGPYRILGGCIGGTIAFETIRKIEQLGEEVKFFIVIDSVAPQKWNEISEFSIESEKAVIRQMFPENSVNQETESINDINTVWKCFIDNVERYNLDKDTIRAFVPKGMEGAIPNYEKAGAKELVYFINTIRTLHNARSIYYPSNKIKTQVYYFEALNDTMIADKIANRSMWNNWLINSLESFPLQADHFSIFLNPHGIEISKLISSIF